MTSPCFPNPDFETNVSDWFTDDADAPDGFIFWGNGSVNISFTRSTTEFHSGVASGHLVQSATESYSTGVGTDINIAGGGGCEALLPDTVYEASIWYKGDASNLFFSVSGSLFNAMTNAVAWTQISAQFTTGPSISTPFQGQVAVIGPIFGGVTFDIYIDDLTIIKVPQADADTSTVTAYPSSVYADGVTFSTITVILRDVSSVPLAGKTVSLAADAGDSIISAPSGVSDVDGTVTFTVTDDSLETVTYTATIED